MIEHFNEKKIHTEIKHKLFYDTFTAILGIASAFSNNNSFAYIDLYAGAGMFSDQTYGSPLLALKSIVDSEPLLEKFHEVKCFFSEADELRVQTLTKHIQDLEKVVKIKNLKVNIEGGSWAYDSESLNSFLKWSKWGFLFVDPFANEVNLDNLFTLIKEKCNRIDFMIFINTQAMKRIVGSDPYRQDIADFLGVDVSELSVTMQNDESIRAALQNRFKVSGKDYILNASIPTTRKGSLVKTDNFQLLLGTNSVGVSDAFLKSYVEAIKIFNNEIGLDLMDTIADNIVMTVKQESRVSLLKIYQELYKNNNSWKYADIYNVPITDNIHKKVNELIKSGIIRCIASENYISKKDNILKKSAFQKNSNMREVFLEYKS